MRRRHRPAHRADEVCLEIVEVDFVTEIFGERIEGSRCVVPRSIESPIDRVLDAAADRLEQREGDERRCRDRQVRALSQRPQQRLKSDDPGEEEDRDDAARRSVDHRPIY